MKRLSIFRKGMVLAVLLSGVASSMSAESWRRGAVVLVEASGPAILRQVGGDASSVDEFEGSRYLSGLLQLESSEASTLRMEASNGVSLSWKGPGYFAFERFDQYLPDNDRSEGFSRMRLNLREGNLILDSRSLSGASQLIVETPLGRIQAVDALWRLSIDYDPGSRMYQFSIACLDGSVRFADRRDELYRLRGGQRLAGVGAATHPAIEVAELEDATREMVRESGFAADEAAEPIDLEPFLPHMEELVRPEAGLDEIRAANRRASPAEEGEKRRFIIEFAPSAPELTPYKGVIRPPSDDESDLF